MKYTNEMRAAIRGLKNPTPLHFDVAQKGDQLILLVDNKLYQKLDQRQRRDFGAYLKDVIAIIELGGGGPVMVTRLKEPR